MSRLDDELRLAFRREEPSADFAERLLARINLEQRVEPEPQRGFWQALLSFFQPSALRWTVAAAAVLLIAVIGFVQYQKLQKPAAEQQVKHGTQAPSGDTEDVASAPKTANGNDDNAGNNRNTARQDQKKDLSGGKEPHEPKHFSPRATPVRQHLARRTKRPAVSNENDRATTQNTQVAAAVKSQGELAKEQLMKALAITSSLLSEAKEVAIGGRE